MDDLPTKESSRSVPNRLLPSSALELAKLAALLDGNDHLCRNSPEAALVIAARLYVKSVVIHDELARMSEDQLLQHLAVTELPALTRMQFDHAIHQMYEDRLKEGSVKRLYLETANLNEASTEGHVVGDLDTVRIYLNEKSTTFTWKTARTVIESILRFYKDKARRHNERNKDRIEETERHLAKRLDDRLREHAEQQGKSIDELSVEERAEIESKRFPQGLLLPEDRRFTGQELYDEAMRKCAVVNYTTGKIICWNFSTRFLDDLLDWRLATKKVPGGVKFFDKLK